MNFPSQESHYIRIKRILSLFNQLTKTHLSFVDTSLHLVSSDGLLLDSTKIVSFFYKKGPSLFFPLITNDQFNGMFIVNKNSIPVNVTTLYQEALHSISLNVLSAYYQKIDILSPLAKDELEKGGKLFSLIASGLASKNKISTSKFENSSDFENSDGVNNIDIALTYIEHNIDQKLTLVNVSKNSYLSPAYLSRLFKEYFKINFSNYIRARKIALAQTQLISTDEPIDKVSRKIGFSRANYFNKVFKETTNLTPLQFRKMYTGAKKIYTIHRELEWNDNISVYAVSRQYFQEQGVTLKEEIINGYPCLTSIDGLSSPDNKNGWIYLIDGVQPQTLPSESYVKDKSVIQWIFVTL